MTTMPKTANLSTLMKAVDAAESDDILDHPSERFASPRPTITDVQARDAAAQAVKDAVNQALADDRDACKLNLVWACLKQAGKEFWTAADVARFRVISAEADAIAFGLDEDQPPIGFGTAARTAEGDRLAILVKKLGDGGPVASGIMEESKAAGGIATLIAKAQINDDQGTAP